MRVTGTLAGLRIVVTRSITDTQATIETLEDRGATAFALPTLDFERIEIPSVSLGERLAAADILVVTSVTTVAHLQRAVVSPLSEIVGNAMVLAVGPKTAAALENAGVATNAVAETPRAEGLLALLPEDLSGRHIALPRAERAREILPNTLRQRGASVDTIAIYRTIAAPEAAQTEGWQALAEGVDWVLICSGSAAEHLSNMVAEKQIEPSTLPIAAIGPVAAKQARDLGFDVRLESRGTIDHLLEDLAHTNIQRN